MSVNLFLRPLKDATVQYEYKTDVLSTYNNLEDRIAQRDIPRIYFNYEYAITDYKKAIDLDTELQKNGKATSVWLPDWLSCETVTNVTNGINTVTVNKFVNLAEEQIVLLFGDDNHYEVSQIRSITVNESSAEIEFRSDGEYDVACIMPVYECFLEGDNQQSRINTLTNTFSIQAVVKSPVFSAIRNHDVQFLGHDVLCDNFKLVSNEPSITVYQQVQENDYSIGLKDRFTFFNRMYNSFSVTILATQSELDYIRNFIKRRWGKTYSCFIPSGIADFVKYDNGQVITTSLQVVNSDFDFTARPFVAIYHGSEVFYAKVISANKGNDVTTLTLDSNITHVVLDQNNSVVSSTSVSSIGILPRGIDCIQSLFFARFNDDTITFSIEGNSEDFENVYSIEMPFIETEFYDADNINYDVVDGVVFDKDVLFELKLFTDDTIPANDNDNTYTTAVRTGTQYDTITGKYDGTYAWQNVSVIDKELAREGEKDPTQAYEVDRWLINNTQDFVLQIECKFNTTTVKSGDSTLMTASAYHHGIDIGVVKGLDGNMYPYVAFHIANVVHASNETNLDNIVITKFNGDVFDDFHEIAIQRTNGITYVYCDGYLNGSSISCKGEKLFKGVASSTSDTVYYIDFCSNLYPYTSCGYVQQVRLMLNKNIYTGTQMTTMNRVYSLFDYSIDEVAVMDNATLIKTDFVYDSNRENWRVTEAYNFLDSIVFADLDLFGQDLCQHPYACIEHTVTGNPDDSWKWSSNNSLDSRVIRSNNFVDLSTRFFHLSLSKYRLPYRWYKDFWLDFELGITGNITDGQTIVYAESLMITFYASGDTWTIGGFGLNPHDVNNAIWVNKTEHINVAFSVDSQHNRVCVYINGQLSLTDTLLNVIRRNERGSIGFYPFVFETLDLNLYKFRLVDCCLTSADLYNVADLWNIGYRTTFFDFEFGRKHEETYPTLRIVNIDTTYEFAPLYDVITNTDYKKNYTYLWSDGSRADKIVNPAGNTLYTVVVTDRRTNDKGYGWFFVHDNFTGEICRSNLSCSVDYNEQGTEVKTDHFGLIRYDYALQKYRETAFFHDSRLTVQQDEHGYYLSSPASYSLWDFFGEVDEETFVPPVISSSFSHDVYHRFFIENYVKQIEFVIMPRSYTISSFTESGNATKYLKQKSSMMFYQGGKLSIDNTSYNVNYLDYLNSRGGSNLSYASSAWYPSQWIGFYTPKYVINKQQSIVYQSVALSASTTSELYYGTSNISYPNHDYMVFERNYVKPIHVVIEPVIMPFQYRVGNAQGFEISIVYRNIWINGQKHNLIDLIKNITIPNNPVDYTGTYFNGITENEEDFRQIDLSSALFSGSSEMLNTLICPVVFLQNNVASNACIAYVKKFLGNLGGCFGYNLNNRNYTMTGFACYDYIKYTTDFDASEKLDNYK